MSDDAPPPAEEPMFAGLKKKTKKKAVNFDQDLTLDESSTAPVTQSDADAAIDLLKADSGSKGASGDAAPAAAEAPAENDGGDMFADLKKKKKKKKEIPMDLDGDSPAPAETPDLGEFGDLKKKKKKKAAFDLEAFEKEIGEAENDADEGAGDGDKPLEVEGDLGDDVFGSTSGGPSKSTDSTTDSSQEPWIGTDRDYTYPELLGRFYHLLHSHNPELAGDKKKLTLVPPQVNREGTKKTVFANLADICKRMHRQPKHVMEFLFAELGTSGSVDGNQRLIIKGRYTQKSMENVLRRYIVEYVVCKTCKSPDTLLNKENRLYFITCESCGSRRSVTTIKSGFQAQIGKRKLQKPE